MSKKVIILIILLMIIAFLGISYSKNFIYERDSLGINPLPELPNPNKDYPISTLHKVNVKIGDKKVIPVKVYNPSEKSDKLFISVHCSHINDSNVKIVPYDGLTVGPHKVGKMKVIINIPSDFPDVDMCTLESKYNDGNPIGKETITLERR